MSHSQQQLRDPAIKLFGRNIPLPELNIPARASPTQLQEECTAATNSEQVDAAERLSDSDGKVASQQTRSQENETELNCSPEEDVGAESDKSRKEKALKKPDKLLPCPRCNSLETKFCYFNNYNVNQPRHFCKNCHRYWTAGGTIRNVPVGAGRRRNQKHSSGSSRQAETNSDEAHQSPSSDSPLCESMQIQLNLKETNKIEPEEPSESSCSSAAATSSDNVGPGNEDYVAPQWAYPWNPGWNFMMVGATSTSPVVTLPAFCPPNVPFPFLPASYWGFMPGWEAGKWAPPSFGPTSPSNSGCSGNSSPSLGKHSRDTNTPAEENTEPSLWAPKTLRIDDPNEAAKSSIWSTLGIEPDRSEGAVRGSMFKPFIRQKPDAKTQEMEADRALHLNPAALSRSHSFQEST